jgi:hypothetical protein
MKSAIGEKFTRKDHGGEQHSLTPALLALTDTASLADVSNQLYAVSPHCCLCACRLRILIPLRRATPSAATPRR